MLGLWSKGLIASNDKAGNGYLIFMDNSGHKLAATELMMAKHKCFEKMEQLDKQDTEDLTDDDFHAYKDCAEAIKHMLEIEQRMHLE